MSDLNVLSQLVLITFLWMIFNFIISWVASILLIRYILELSLEFEKKPLKNDAQLNLDLEFNDETKVKQDTKGYPGKGP